MKSLFDTLPQRPLDNLINLAKQRIKAIFTKYNKPALAFSGGKDSTTLLLLTLEVMQELQTVSLEVIHNDTLVENPVIRQHCDVFLQDLANFVKQTNLNVNIHIAKPQDTYWINLIGKGYPLPNFRFRWCQRHLKIKPAKKLLKELQVDVLLIGVRETESTSRKTSMRKHYKNIQKGKQLPSVAPIKEWTDEHVWTFLSTYQCNWTDLSRIYKIYKDASGECPVFSTNAPTGCGARFGCWVCTLVREDKSLRNLIYNNYHLKPLYEFRQFLIDFCSLPENRTGFDQRGKFLGESKGKLTLKARQTILDKLLQLQQETGLQVISNQELRVIQKLWQEVEL